MFDQDFSDKKDIKDYEERITFLLREIDNMKVYIGKLEAENRKYSKAQEITAEFEKQIQTLTEEKEALETVIHKLESMKSELEMKISTLETDQLTNSRFLKDLKRNLELKIKENGELINKLSFYEDFQREKDRYEQKIKDQQLKIDRLNQDISELTEVSQKKGFDLENYRSKIMQFEDMNRQLARLQSELKDWALKESFWKKEDEKNKRIIQELQDKLRNMSQQPSYLKESEDKSKKIMELENKLALLSTELARLQEEMKKLKDLLISEREKAQEALRKLMKEKDEELARLLREKDQKIQDLMNQLDENKENSERFRRGLADLYGKDEKIKELERKLGLLANEIKELMDSLRNKDQEIRDLMRKMQEKDQDIKSLQYKISGNEQEINRLSQLLLEREDEINELRQQLRETGRNSSILDNLQQEIRLLTQRNFELAEENERLKDLLNKEKLIREELESKLKRFYELEHLCEELKRSLQQYEGKGLEISKKMEVFLEKMKSLEAANADLRKELERVIKERDRYLQENGILVDKVHELEEGNQNYQRILEQTKETMNNMHERITQYETVILEIPAMEAQIEEKTQQIENLMRELEKYSKLQQMNEELERENSQLKEENQNLQYLMNQEMENYEKFMKEASEKLKKSEGKIKELEERLAGYKQENEKLKVQVNELLAMLKENDMGRENDKDFMLKIEASLAEIDTLNKIIAKKDQEIADLQADLDSLSEENAALKEEIEELMKKIKELEEEIELYQNDLKKFRVEGNSQDSRMKDYEAKLNSLLKEIQSLNGLVLKRNEEIDTWRTKYAQLELVINEIRLKDTYLMDMERRMKDLDFENESLRKKINEGSQNIFKFDESPFRTKIDELTVRITEMNQEIKSLNNEIEKKDREIGLRNAEILHYKTENSRSLYIQEGGGQRDQSNYKETIRNLEMALQKEVNEKEKLIERLGKLEKMSQEMNLKEERIMTLENRNQMLMREIEEWKRRHESFQKSIEKEIEKKRY